MSATHAKGPSAPGELPVPGWLQRRGQTLLNQQCWLWGQDVRRNEGNLLLAYGFERTRAPEGVSGSTQYTLTLSNDLRVRLWGFGMYFGGDEGIYINRYEFIPRVARFIHGWQGVETMSRLRRSREANLLFQAASWIATYERWIATEMHVGYRQRTLIGWDEKAVRATEIAKAWQCLAEDLKTSERFRRKRSASHCHHNLRGPYHSVHPVKATQQYDIERRLAKIMVTRYH